MKHANYQTLRASIGCAGWFPSRSRSSPPLWQLLPLGSRVNFGGESPSFYQKAFEPLSFPSFLSESFSFRVAFSGFLWHHNGQGFGEDLFHLMEHLQHWLDEQVSFPQAVKMLDGDFILCYIPPDTSCCWLYRPVTGMRALYYRTRHNGVQWSTSVRDLFEQTPSITDVNLDLLAMATSAAYVDPGRTWYREINCLSAGHGLQLCQDGRIVPFVHDFVITEQRLDVHDAALQFRHLLTQAVERKLYAFPSFGVLLSGGLDSAVIAREICQLRTPIRGIHWTWDLPILTDERACAHAVADFLHIPLDEVNGSSALEEGGTLVRCMQALSLPFHHSFYHAFSLSAQVAKQHDLSVVVSGHLGDALFHGEWLDGFRANVLVDRWNPVTWLRLLRNLLFWYSRGQAIKIGVDLFMGRSHRLHKPVSQRLASCQTWLTTKAFEQVSTSGTYQYDTPHSDVIRRSTREMYQLLKQEIDSNTHLDAILLDHAFLPQHVELLHPYADKRLIEFCLGLGPLHRAGFATGIPLSKVLLRYAYLEDLPPQIIRREVRVPYIAVNRTYCQHNQGELLGIFGKQSCLAQLGIINPDAVEHILSDPIALQRHSGSLIPAAGVELWLRHLSNMPLLTTPSPRIHTVQLPEAFKCKQFQETGVARLTPPLVTKEISGSMILLNRSTQDVIQLSQDATSLLCLFLTLSSWEEIVMVATQLWYDMDGDELLQQIHALTTQLVEGEWITLRIPCIIKEADNV